MLRSHKRLRYLGKTQGPGELPYPQGLTADAEYHKTRPRRRRSPILNTTDRGRTPTVAGRYSPRPGPNTIHQYDPTRKDTKKIMANANSTYSEPPTKVMAKAPRRAPPPTMMQAMVTIAAILLVNNTGVPSSKLLNRPSHILYNVLPRRARSTKRPAPKEPAGATSWLLCYAAGKPLERSLRRARPRPGAASLLRGVLRGVGSLLFCSRRQVAVEQVAVEAPEVVVLLAGVYQRVSQAFVLSQQGIVAWAERPASRPSYILRDRAGKPDNEGDHHRDRKSQSADPEGVV